MNLSKEEIQKVQDFIDKGCDNETVEKILKDLLEENVDPAIYACHYYESNVTDEVANIIMYQEEASVTDEELNTISDRIKSEVALDLTNYEDYPTWEDFESSVSKVFHKHYKIENNKVISID